MCKPNCIIQVASIAGLDQNVSIGAGAIGASVMVLVIVLNKQNVKWANLVHSVSTVSACFECDCL